MRRRWLLPGGLVVAVAIVVAVAASGGSGAKEPAAASAATHELPRASDAVLTRRNRDAQVVEPVAGESADDAALPVEASSDSAAPKPTAAASSTSSARLGHGNGPTKDAAVSDAEVLKNGIALPPIEAPSAVRSIIEAGNYIARTPYLWGGGHGRWLDKGYDCSGSISYALARAGLLNAPLDSGRLMGWGEPGPGKWVSIYASPVHVYMVVAGVRFDTAGTRTTGSRWQSSMRPGGGFVVRHPAGL